MLLHQVSVEQRPLRGAPHLPSNSSGCSLHNGSLMGVLSIASTGSDEPAWTADYGARNSPAATCDLPGPLQHQQQATAHHILQQAPFAWRHCQAFTQTSRDNLRRLSFVILFDQRAYI